MPFDVTKLNDICFTAAPAVTPPIARRNFETEVLDRIGATKIEGDDLNTLFTRLQGLQPYPYESSNKMYTESILNNTYNGQMLYHSSKGPEDKTLTAIFTYEEDNNKLIICMLASHITSTTYKILWCLKTDHINKTIVIKGNKEY
ncbi:hypothetical protein ACIXFK_03835 [Bacteroides fragilis]|uniref:hypothetical protein n=1 Tax=Bacteroides fragilis TaxID=817 RepID=UPI0023661E17|nr:hypothetical protein [Bacteroides fragilis]